MENIIQQTRAAYNKIAHHFSDTRSDLWPELRQFTPLVKDGQNILDWGCGNGRLILLLKGKKVKYLGVDISEELIKIAKKKYAKEMKEGWVRFICTDDSCGNPLSISPLERGRSMRPPEFFDLVFMIASFHHLPDKASRLKLLKKVRAAMKPGAKLAMTNWNLESEWARKKIARTTPSRHPQVGITGWRKIGQRDFVIPWKNTKGEVEAERYYHCFAGYELRALLARAGFKVEKMGYDYTDKSQHTDKKGGRNLVTIATKISC